MDLIVRSDDRFDFRHMTEYQKLQTLNPHICKDVFKAAKKFYNTMDTDDNLPNLLILYQCAFTGVHCPIAVRVSHESKQAALSWSIECLGKSKCTNFALNLHI